MKSWSSASALTTRDASNSPVAPPWKNGIAKWQAMVPKAAAAPVRRTPKPTRSRARTAGKGARKAVAAALRDGRKVDRRGARSLAQRVAGQRADPKGVLKDDPKAAPRADPKADPRAGPKGGPRVVPKGARRA